MGISKKAKSANDKLHPSDLGETKDFNELVFDKDRQSYEYDVKGKDEDYDHPLPYETISQGAVDDDSTYDEANPYVGDEYEKPTGRPSFDEPGMNIDEEGNSIEVSPEDRLLSRTPEDLRDDLDEEGYPKNDRPLP